MERKMVVKNRKWICLLLSMVTLLAGCGSRGGGQPAGNSSMGSDAQTGNTTDAAAIERMAADGIYDLEMEEERLASPMQEGEVFLGAQYYNGERIWFIGNEEGQVFGYYEERDERELLLEDVLTSRRSAGCKWCRDEEYFYVLNSISLLVLQADGETAYEIKTEDRIMNMSLSKEGDVILVTENRSRYNYVLKTLNPETGTLSDSYTISDCFGIAEGAAKGVLVIDFTGAYDLDVGSGEKIWYMRWSGTSYSPNINSHSFYTFKMTEDGGMDLLQGEIAKKEFYSVKIRKINPDEMEKIPLVFRVAYANSGLKLLVARFNQQNQEYHVFLQDRGGEVYGDFVARTDMEIATGKGPDMFEDDVVSDIYALAAKGALENLEPYFAQSTIDRNDYYPAAFQNFGREEGLYGVGYEMCADTMYIREELTGGSQEIGLAALLDNMENYDEQMIFNAQYHYTPDMLLRYFFQMSQDFYGMVDWEQKSCSFNGELWEKILRVSKEYGMTDRNREWEEAANPVTAEVFSGFAAYDAYATQEGMVMVGYPAEDGMVSCLRMGTIAMNADSVHKEGVWQFIQFLLEEENQKLVLSDILLPVHEKVLSDSVNEAGSRQDYHMIIRGRELEVIISQEMLDRFWRCLDSAKPASYRTEQVLAIIQEEAELYFTGDKSIEEVSAVIENRVRLYLAEQ